MNHEFSPLIDQYHSQHFNGEYPVRFTRKEQLGMVGNAVIAGGTWGNEITAKQFLDNHLVTPEKKQELREMIINSGFRSGFHINPDIDPMSPEMQVRQAYYGAMLVEEVMNAREWNGIDRLTVGSASTLPEAAFLIPTILAKRGLAVEQTQFIGLACASAITSFGLNQRDPDMIGLRVVNLGIETLGGKYINEPHMEWIFGNGGAAIGSIPGKDFTHIHGRIKILPDKRGVIRTPRTYELPKKEDRVPLNKLPQWTGISWDDKFNPIIDDYFAVDKSGNFYLLLPKNDGEFSSMSAHGTYGLFVGSTPAFALEVIEESGENIDLVSAHQASGGVNEGIVKRIKEIKPNIRIPWVMRKLGLCNVSAATSLFALKEVAKDFIKKGKPFAILSMGIGACLQEDILVEN